MWNKYGGLALLSKVVPFTYWFQCYRRILELEPENVQGLHNLCVVYVERGQLVQAETCLQSAHTLAPTEDYILRHLRIVQQRLRQQDGGHQQTTTQSQDGGHQQSTTQSQDGGQSFEQDGARQHTETEFQPKEQKTPRHGL